MDYNKKRLAFRLGVSVKVLNRHYENWKEQIGPYVGKKWTTKQVKIWLKLMEDE